MKNKELTRRQARYLNILSKFNFQIIFRVEKNNNKVDAFTRMSRDNKDQKTQNSQIILTSDRVEIRVSETVTNLFDRIHEVNKVDELCQEYCQAIMNNISKLHEVQINECRIIDDVLFKNNLLWVSKGFYTELLQEVHDQPFSEHSGINRTVDLVRRHYYWPGHVTIVKQYIRNCHHCQRNKVLRDVTNELLISLSILEQRWQDIVMNLIIKLFMSKGYNVICTIIDRLLKERHYVSCHFGDEGTFINKLIEILLWNVYRLHGLLSSITFDRGSQFVSTLWKSMCKRLRIKTNLLTAYHSETDD